MIIDLSRIQRAGRKILKQNSSGGSFRHNRSKRVIGSIPFEILPERMHFWHLLAGNIQG
jgi:hypothetical protein